MIHSKKTRANEQKYTLADHHRAALLNGSDPSSLADDEETRLERPSSTSLSRTQDNGYGNMHMHADRQPLTHVQSQAQLRSEAVSAFNALTGDDDDDSDDEAGTGDLEERVDGLLVKRQKGGDEVEEDEEDYRKFLIDMGGGEEAVRKILGMGDQPVPRVAIDAENEEGQSDDAAEGGKKVGGISKEEKRSRRRAKEEKKKEVKAKQDDDFLMK
jgi:hypothetical protein